MYSGHHSVRRTKLHLKIPTKSYRTCPVIERNGIFRQTQALRVADAGIEAREHTCPSFNTGTEDTIQVSEFKGISFEKKMADFDGSE